MQKLFKKLKLVMEDITHIPKNGYNKEQKYHFALEYDILHAVRKSFMKNNIGMTTSFTEHTNDFVEVGTKLRVYSTVVCIMTLVDLDSGEMTVISGRGFGVDYGGDKAMPKAETAAVKYLLSKTFLIPTGDDPEGDDQTEGEPTENESIKPKPVDQKTLAFNKTVKSTIEQSTVDGKAEKLDALCVSWKLSNGTTDLSKIKTSGDRHAFVNELKKVLEV